MRVTIPDARAALGLGDELGDVSAPVADPTIAIDDLVDRLMGKNAERRFEFIQDNAEFAQDIDI